MPNFRDNEGRDAEGDNGGEQSDDICRDFLRNNCSRGNRCRYRHPNDVDNGNNGNSGRQSGSGGEPEFCHDFQNAGCRRVNCRFVHCTRDEEEHYRRTGQIPPSGGPDGPRGKGNRFDDQPPVCKDFLKGDCHRGRSCKYRHVSQRELDMEDRQRERMMMMDRGSFGDGPFPGGPMRFDDDMVVGGKRRFMDDGQFGGMMGDRRMINPEEVQMLQEENAILRQKVDQLRKQVADLTATNETLLEQNARFRSGQMRAPAGPVLAPGPASALNGASELMTPRQGNLGGYGEPSSMMGGGGGQLQMGASSMAPSAFGMQRNPGIMGGPRPGLVSYPLLSHSQNARLG